VTQPDGLAMPRNLLRSVETFQDPGLAAWVRTAPGRIHQIASQWSLEIGAPYQPGGTTAWVAPVRRPDGSAAVLKVGWAHPEVEHEPDGLRLWAGEGTVLLYDLLRAGDTTAMLLERCVPGTELGQSRPESEQDEVLARVLRRLWRAPPAGAPFRPLAQMCDAWAAEYDAAPHPSLDRGLERAGLALFRSLPRDPVVEQVLLTDLHAGNVLAADREPWLVIDVKPYVGDPCYDPLQHLYNCRERLFADPWGLADRVAQLCEVDSDRVRLWLFARTVVESAWAPELAELVPRLAPR
jgi:streptomycin 6-kinase